MLPPTRHFEPRSNYMRGLICTLVVLATVLQAARAADEITIEHDGARRTYLVHRPSGDEPTVALPLVVALHGTNMRAADMLRHTDLARKADAAKFILASPNSLGTAFNDGFAPAGSDAAVINDVGFIQAVVEDAKARYRIRADSIFLVGFSSGGSMVQRMAIESRYPFAGYASVANTVRVKTEGIANRAPTLLVFGTADPLNPVAGGEVAMPVTSVKPSHESTAKGWADRLGCQGNPVVAAPDKGVQARIWTECPSGARLAWYEIAGLGHHWAGAEPMPFPSFIIGEQVAAPNLTDLIWGFFNPGPK
jgi:polyhydroxybutyrate depolymerase